ncbi:MAG: hypothetical protein Q7K33_00305 [Candidatus Berkelbacteria bacterium]|nr:hypothetical protein [Candidatus Berkelbacteria bacterium]
MPYTLPANGQLVQKVLIDWKNTSDLPAGAAFADIVAYDADGEKLQSGTKDYCIFSYDGCEESKILPGKTYIEPDDDGYVLLSNAFGRAEHVEAKITKLLDC